MTMRSISSTAAVLALSLTLAGCLLDRVSGLNEPPVANESPVTSAPKVAPPPAPPPVNMAGRWRLVSAAGGACGMTFTGAPPVGTEGTIAPEGGCPGNFFTSRRWLFDQGSLVLRDHTGKPLVQMAQSSSGRFEGRLGNGELVWLER